MCRRCLVSGKVQGVFFRASTQREARMLGLTGHAANLPDGRVEVLVCGDEAAVKALIDWLWEGPQHAEVENVETEATKVTAMDAFNIR